MKQRLLALAVQVRKAVVSLRCNVTTILPTITEVPKMIPSSKLTERAIKQIRGVGCSVPEKILKSVALLHVAMGH